MSVDDAGETSEGRGDPETRGVAQRRNVVKTDGEQLQAGAGLPENRGSA